MSNAHFLVIDVDIFVAKVHSKVRDTHCKMNVHTKHEVELHHLH